MKVAVMQPYFLPYLGYWQLANTVDVFVIYDQIEYTKKGWINRNRILVNGDDAYITLPLKKGSDHLLVNERELAGFFFDKERPAMLRRVEAAYRKAPFLTEGLDVLGACLDHQDYNLFNFLYHSIQTIFKALSIETPIIVSSSLELNDSLRGQERVIAICCALECSEYINPPGGKHLYDSTSFANKGIGLRFMNPKISPYSQMGTERFFECLSIVDVLMNVGISAIKSDFLTGYIE